MQRESNNREFAEFNIEIYINIFQYIFLSAGGGERRKQEAVVEKGGGCDGRMLQAAEGRMLHRPWQSSLGILPTSYE